MSATLVPIDHIDLLVSACERYKLDMVYCVKPDGTGYLFDATDDATWTGALLLNENVQSVQETYGRDAEYESLPGPDARVTPDAYRYKPVPVVLSGNLSPVHILKACDGYEYQSCDHDGYPSSIANRIIQSIRRLAIQELDGYADSPGWLFTRDSIPV